MLSLNIAACLSLLVVSGHAQEPATAEKIGDLSPDKNFAMRIRYDGEMNQQLIEGEKADSGKIFSEAIKAIELISLPSKRVVANLLPAEDVDSHFGDITLVWSADSKWCAFYYAFPRVGYTTAYNLRGDKFVEANKPDNLRIKVNGDVRNEFVRPLRWTKPAILVLEQWSMFRGADSGQPDDARIQLTVKFEGKKAFRLIGKKKLSTEEATGN